MTVGFNYAQSKSIRSLEYRYFGAEATHDENCCPLAVSGTQIFLMIVGVRVGMGL